MLGISVYLSDLDEAYIQAASQYNVKYIFTSLHIPEENFQNFDENLNKLLSLSKMYNLEIIPDISPYTFEKLHLANNDYAGLKALGFNIVRLDFGYEDLESLSELSKYFQLVLNASVVDEKYLNSLASINLDLSDIHLMHNFYPRAETGLSRDYFKQLHSEHEKLSLSSMVFVVGDHKKRLPMYEGLITLEEHRNQNPYVSVVMLRKLYNVKSMFIGDNQAKVSSLRLINDFLVNDIVTIPAYLNEDYHYLYDDNLTVRQEMANSLIRLRTKRIENVESVNNNHRNRGAIVMDNYLAKRYSGEISLIKQTMEFSSRSNNIGWIHPDYTDLLDYIDFKQKIKFIRIEEVEK